MEIKKMVEEVLSMTNEHGTIIDLNFKFCNDEPFIKAKFADGFEVFREVKKNES